MATWDGNKEYHTDVTYGSGEGSPKNLDKPLEPTDNMICIWGASFTFDPNSGKIVFGGGGVGEVGHIVF